MGVEPLLYLFISVTKEQSDRDQAFQQVMQYVRTSIEENQGRSALVLKGAMLIC